MNMENEILTRRTAQAFWAVSTEVHRARKKFPGRKLLFAALVEEVGELANAIIEGGDWETEAKHVACVSIRIMTEGDETHGIGSVVLDAEKEGNDEKT